MADTRFDFSDDTISLTKLFTHLSTKLRSSTKQHYKFYADDIHPKDAYMIDMEDTRITDTSKCWYTYRTDCFVRWGDVKYFEVIAEKINTNRFIMIGLVDERYFQQSAGTCIHGMRFYPSDHGLGPASQNALADGTHIGILYDTQRDRAILYIDGKKYQHLFDFSGWTNKDEKRFVVVCMACGDNCLQINNNAIEPHDY